MSQENSTLMRRTNLFGAWCGIIYCALIFIGWWLFGGFFPLHEPSAGKEEIAEFFRGDVIGIRIGMVIVMWGSMLFLFFTATMAHFVSRVEGRSGPLTYTMIMAGFANAIFTFYPAIWWVVNTFRSVERSAESIYFMNDFAWIQFIGALSLIMPMYIVIAVVALNDKSEHPVFPRWSGYLSLWVFILFLPDQLLFFFKTGPFAWNGLFAFWLPLTAFCGWFITIFWLMRRAILREGKEARLAQADMTSSGTQHQVDSSHA